MKNKVIDLIKSLDINCTEEKLDLLNEYYLFLTEYNKHTNLTAITDEYEVYLKHIYDSLLITKAVDLSKINNALDIGSGAGFPGVVLKIFFPNINLTVIDSNNKKTKFLKELTHKLNLDVEVINNRVENLPLNKYNSYDLVVSRAVAFVDIITSLSLPFIKENGKVILMKGDFEEEDKILKNNKDQLNIKDYKIIDVSYYDNIRKLVLITKQNSDKETINYSKIIKRNKKWKL